MAIMILGTLHRYSRAYGYNELAHTDILGPMAIIIPNQPDLRSSHAHLDYASPNHRITLISTYVCQKHLPRHEYAFTFPKRSKFNPNHALFLSKIEKREKYHLFCKYLGNAWSHKETDGIYGISDPDSRWKCSHREPVRQNYPLTTNPD